MNDSRITAFINAILPTGSNTTVPQAQVVSLPPNMAQNGAIKGEVIAVDNGEVTIKTQQGNVILKTDMPIQVGQTVNIKLQRIVQQAVTQMVADLSVVVDPKNKGPLPPPSTSGQTGSAQTNPGQSAQQTQQPSRIPIDLPSPVTQIVEGEIQLSDVLKLPVQPLDAKVFALPEAVTEQDLAVLIKAVLNLTPTDPLPTTLKEGLDKLKTLLPLLTGTTVLPTSDAPETPLTTSIPSLATLIQALQSSKTPEVLKTVLAQVPLQQLLVLQKITPGQILTSDILAAIKEQITVLLQTASKPAMSSQTTLSVPNAPDIPVFENKLSSLLTGLVAKITPDKVTQLLNPAATPNTPVSIPETITSYQPLMGLVLGQAKTIPVDGKIPVLLFLTTQNGQQVISFASLTAPNNLPATTLLPGTIIMAAVNAKAQITFLPAQTITMPTTAGQGIVPLQLSIGNDWQVIDQLWQEALVQQVTHPDAMAALRQTIPTPTAQQMPAAVLFFLSVLKNGLLPHWAGDHIADQLQLVDKANIISQLSRDLQAIRNAMNDTSLPTDGWRPLPVPLNVNDQIYRLQWFYRHDNAFQQDSLEDTNDKLSRKTRFLVDVPKTRFGDIQIDGLVQQKMLDVILRTETDIRNDMQMAIRKRYQGALETTGFAGEIIFQSGRQHYIKA